MSDTRQNLDGTKGDRVAGNWHKKVAKFVHETFQEGTEHRRREGDHGRHTVQKQQKKSFKKYIPINT